MPYLIAIMALAAIAVLAWKAFGPQLGHGRNGARRPMGPDDDPEFLGRIGHKRTDDHE